MAHRLSLPQPPPSLPWAPAGTPSAWLCADIPEHHVGFRSRGPEGGPAGGRNSWCSRLNLLPRVSRPRGRGGWDGGGGLVQPERRSPLSWRDIKTRPKCFHVVPALGLCPSRWINPRAARTDMSSQLRFHVCPQFQCHHTKSRLIVNRPPPPPLRRLPSPLRLPCPHLDPTNSPGGPGDVLRL